MAGIRDMQVRGAPLIGVAAAHGLAIAAGADSTDRSLQGAADELLATRLTAINLRWAIERCMAQALATTPATG